MEISFSQAGQFNGISGGPQIVFNPTSLTFGPDERLYVTEQDGTINAFTIALSAGEYVATDVEEIKLVQQIQNHNDDGSLSDLTQRLVTGIVTTGTAANPVLYVSSSDPRTAQNQDKNLDTNSGVITRLTWNGSDWEAVDIIRGLPRSEENHTVNGMTLSPDGSKLYVSVGGNTNNGAPSAFFAYTGEYALSGTVLEVDLNDIDARAVLTDPNGGQGGTARNYIYDLPTLDDPNKTNGGAFEDANGADIAGPWGGNDGLNMAILPADAPLRIYADGFRNSYDLVFTEAGNLYTVDNGSNSNFGGDPIVDANGEATNEPNGGGIGNPEPLFLIEDGEYYGHPAPARSNQDQAWTSYDDDGNPDTDLSQNTVPNLAAQVPDSVNIEDGFIIDPSKFTGDASRLLESGIRVPYNDPQSNTLVNIGSSSNGLVEYTGDAFDGALKGDLLVAQFNGNIGRLDLSADGTSATYSTIDGLGSLALPLDVTVGPNGTVWVAEIGGDFIKAFNPSDEFDPILDVDGDGINNPDDPFIRDPANGTTAILLPGQTLTWDFDENLDGNLPGISGFGGGLTGVMIDGETDFEAFFLEPASFPDQNIKLDNVKFATAAGGGTTVIENASNGDPTGNNNNGEYLFHTGLTVSPIVEAFTIQWSVLNPASALIGPSQQLGGYIGTGDQSNFLKFVAIQGGTGEILVALENNDATVSESFIQANDLFDVPVNSQILFQLTVDPVAETAVPAVSYDTPTGMKSVSGAPVSLSGTNVLEAIKGNNTVQGQTTGLAVGLFSSNVGQAVADTFQATFDEIVVTAAGSSNPSTVLYRVNAGGAQVAATDGGPAWTEDQSAELAIGSANIGTPSVFLVDRGVDGDDKTFGDATPVGPGVNTTNAPGALFTTERWSNLNAPNNLGYAFEVSAGEYQVNLYFDELFFTAEGSRIFDVEIEGELVLDDFDTFATYGNNSGVQSFITTVVDGELNIEFLKGAADNPHVSALEIISTESFDISTVSIGNPSPSTIEETGDTGFTTLVFPVTFDQAPSSNVVVEYSVNIDGQTTSGLTQALGTTGGNISVDVANDDINNGSENILVTLTGLSVNNNVAVLGNSTATATVTEDDELTSNGTVIYRINAGGAEIAATDGGLAWSEDQSAVSAAGSANIGTPSVFLIDRGVDGDDKTFGDVTPVGPGINNSGAPGALFVTERFSGLNAPNNLGYAFEVSNGDYVVNLYFDELFYSTAGSRVFDVEIEGNLVLDDFDTYGTFGNDSGVQSINATVLDGELNIEFLKGAADNPHIAAIEVISISDLDISVVSVGAPTPSTLQEDGDTGVTTLIFPVTFDQTPGSDVTVEYSVSVNGAVTSGLTQTLGTSDGSITVDIPNDDQNNGSENVTVTLTGLSVGNDIAILGTTNADATVTEDDEDIVQGDVVVAINAGGPAITQNGINFTADQFFINGGTFTDSNAGNGQQPVFDGTVYETERFGGSAFGDPLSYSIPIASGDYIIELYFAELFFENPGSRVFDVTVEGQQVLDNLDILAQTGGDFNQPLVIQFPDTFSPDTFGAIDALDIELQASTNNAKISGIVVRGTENTPPEIAPIPDIVVDEGQTVAFTVDSSDAQGDAIALSVAVVNDATGESVDPAEYSFTDNGDGTGTFNWATDDLDDGAYTVSVIGSDGNSQSTETFALTINNIEPPNTAPEIIPLADLSVDEGQTVAFTVDAADAEGDAIALSVEVTNDSDGSLVNPADYSFVDNGDGTGSFTWLTDDADDGVYSVAVTASDGELNSVETFALTVVDIVIPTVSLSVNTNTASEDDTTELIFTVTASDAVNGDQTVEVALAGTGIIPEDFTGDIPTILTIPSGNTTASFSININDDDVVEQLETATLSIGNPSAGITLGDIATVDVVIADNDVANNPPLITPLADITIDEGQEASFAITATDNEGDAIALSVAVTNDSDGSLVNPADYSFVDNGDGTGSFTWSTSEPDDGKYTVTVTASDGVDQSTETFSLTVNEVSIPDPVTVDLSVNTNVASEANQTEITVTVIASATVNADQTVDLDLSGLNISAGDFVGEIPATLTIAAGESSASATFSVNDDTLIEGNETATLTLNNPSAGLQLGTVTSADITITDNDESTPPDGRISDQLLALYTFDEGSGGVVNDVSGVGAALDLTIGDVADVTWGNGTLTLNTGTQISSGVPALKLFNGLTDTNEITIEAWIATQNLLQTGPARVVSLSASSILRNFTLGQAGDDFVGRLRTSQTNLNGTNKAVVTQDGQASTDLTHVIYTRDVAGDASIYVDGELVANQTVGGDFSNWANDYQLFLGNEANGKRPWLGTYDLVAIYNQSFDSNEVQQNYEAGTETSHNQPTALDEAFVIAEDSSLTGNVLTNDSDPNGGSLTSSLLSGPQNGTLDLEQDGDFTYTPDNNFNGVDSFTYRVQTEGGGFASATTTITVEEDFNNNAPIANNDNFATSSGDTLTFNVLVNDTDVDGDSISLASFDDTSLNGTLIDNGNGSFTYTPDAGFVGVESFTYTVFDGLLESNTATVSITVEDGTTTTRVTDQLLALYTFDEGAGNAVNDVSGTGDNPLHLVIDNPDLVTWGTDGTLTVNGPTLIQSANAATKIIDGITGDELTIEAWISTEDLTQAGPARIATLSNGAGERNFTLGQKGDAFNVRLRTTQTTLNGTLPAVSGGDIEANTYNHVVYTRDVNGLASLYLNNELVVTKTVGGSFANWDDGYQFGLANELTGNRPWLGSFDLVAIYGQALDSQEVNQNFLAGPGDLA